MPLEPNETLLLARAGVIRGSQDEWNPDSGEWGEAQTELFSGDEQVAWATAHVDARLTDAIAMMGASIKAIDSVVGVEEDVEFPHKPHNSASLLLADGGENIETTAANLAKAAEGLGLLRIALTTWAERGELA